jgi:hypothetical protein
MFEFSGYLSSWVIAKLMETLTSAIGDVADEVTAGAGEDFSQPSIPKDTPSNYPQEDQANAVPDQSDTDPDLSAGPVEPLRSLPKSANRPAPRSKALKSSALIPRTATKLRNATRSLIGTSRSVNFSDGLKPGTEEDEDDEVPARRMSTSKPFSKSKYPNLTSGERKALTNEYYDGPSPGMLREHPPMSGMSQKEFQKHLSESARGISDDRDTPAKQRSRSFSLQNKNLPEMTRLHSGKARWAGQITAEEVAPENAQFATPKPSISRSLASLRNSISRLSLRSAPQESTKDERPMSPSEDVHVNHDADYDSEPDETPSEAEEWDPESSEYSPKTTGADDNSNGENDIDDDEEEGWEKR